MLFPVDKKFVLTSRNEELGQKYVSVEEKTASAGNSWLVFEKMEENVFH